MKRLFWGLVGLGMGAVIGVGVMRWASRTADRLAPRSLASELVQTAADWRERLARPCPRARQPWPSGRRSCELSSPSRGAGPPSALARFGETAGSRSTNARSTP